MGLSNNVSKELGQYIQGDNKHSTKCNDTTRDIIWTYKSSRHTVRLLFVGYLSEPSLHCIQQSCPMQDSMMESASMCIKCTSGRCNEHINVLHYRLTLQIKSKSEAVITWCERKEWCINKMPGSDKKNIDKSCWTQHDGQQSYQCSWCYLTRYKIANHKTVPILQNSKLQDSPIIKKLHVKSRNAKRAVPKMCRKRHKCS